MGIKITVFTPTYNRAHIIEQLYHSLQRQTCMDFEWLVVDDGSCDNTEELFQLWRSEKNKFLIRYYKRKNGGKHRAINYALTKAEGELFFIVDSDDQLTENAIDLVLHQLSSLPKNGNKKYAGVCNLKAYSMSAPVGTSFDGDYIDCTSLEREKYGISGDKAEVVFTDIIRQYPFPEIEREKFVTEAVVWDRIAADGYCFRFYNEINYLCEYREDGLTNQGLSLYYRNPKGYSLYLRQCRDLHKFSEAVQNYFEVQCYINWKHSMDLREIAKLLGLKQRVIIYRTIMYVGREKISKLKNKIIDHFRRKR